MPADDKAFRTIVQVEKRHNELYVQFADELESIIPIDELSLSLAELNFDTIEVHNSNSIVIQRKDGGEEVIAWDVARRFGDPEFAKDQEREDIRTRKRLGEHLKKLRQEAGLTQIKLAGLAGISRHTISRIENGENYPNSSTLRKLAVSLDLNFSDLLNPSLAPKPKASREESDRLNQSATNEFENPFDETATTSSHL